MRLLHTAERASLQARLRARDEALAAARERQARAGGGIAGHTPPDLAALLDDVVQAYAGGIRPDPLFIDEGLGSLDPESLDRAMRALVDLQQKGRMVGIISHVDELKRQIGAGIEVIPGPAGSRARVGKLAPLLNSPS